MGAGESEQEPAGHLGANERLEPLRGRGPAQLCIGLSVEREAVLEEEIGCSGVPVADGGGVHHNTYRRLETVGKIPGVRELTRGKRLAFVVPPLRARGNAAAEAEAAPTIVLDVLKPRRALGGERLVRVPDVAPDVS